MSALDLLKRLNYLNEYAKKKATRKSALSGNSSDNRGTTSGGDGGRPERDDDDEDDDEDIDGVPLDENSAALAGSTAAGDVAKKASSASGKGAASPVNSSKATGTTLGVGRGQWKSVNLGDPSSSSDDEDGEDVDGVPLDGPDAAMAAKGGLSSSGRPSSVGASQRGTSIGGGVRRSRDLGHPESKAPGSSLSNSSKNNGSLSDGLMSPPPPVGSRVSSPRGRSLASGRFQEKPEHLNASAALKAGGSARRRGSGSDSDDSDGEGAGPGKIDVWGDAERAAQEATTSLSSSTTGAGVGSAGVSLSGDGGDTAPKMSEKEQVRVEGCRSRICTEV